MMRLTTILVGCIFALTALAGSVGASAESRLCQTAEVCVASCSSGEVGCVASCKPEEPGCVYYCTVDELACVWIATCPILDTQAYGYPLCILSILDAIRILKPTLHAIE